MLARGRLGSRRPLRLGCSFWLALLAVVTNPLLWRLLGLLLALLVQFVGSHLLLWLGR